MRHGLAPHPQVSLPLRIAAVMAMVFGVLTLFSAGNVLFGPAASRALAGSFVDYVVWFNFFAGLLYMVAAIGIWRLQSWSFPLSIAIAVMTGLVAIPFAAHVLQGQPFEMRTIGALILRIGFWAAIAVAIWRQRRVA